MTQIAFVFSSNPMVGKLQLASQIWTPDSFYKQSFMGTGSHTFVDISHMAPFVLAELIGYHKNNMVHKTYIYYLVLYTKYLLILT